MNTIIYHSEIDHSGHGDKFTGGKASSTVGKYLNVNPESRNWKISVDNCGDYDIIDCGNDDYFSLSPGDRFTGRWNSADSVFLVRVEKQTTWVPIAGRHE